MLQVIVLQLIGAQKRACLIRATGAGFAVLSRSSTNTAVLKLPVKRSCKMLF